MDYEKETERWNRAYLELANTINPDQERPALEAARALVARVAELEAHAKERAKAEYHPSQPGQEQDFECPYCFAPYTDAGHTGGTMAMKTAFKCQNCENEITVVRRVAVTYEVV